MQVSIIIPTYCPGEYFWECLDSIRKQEFPIGDFEIIIILNGCNDPYKTRIDNYISQNLKDYNVVFIQTDVPGVSNARNIGLDVAKGDYITFIDDDDYISECYLSELCNRATPNIISFSNTIAFRTDGKGEKHFLNIYYVQNHYNQRAKYGLQPFYKVKCFAGPCMKLFHKSIIGNRRFNTKFTNGEDSLFMFLISDRMQFVDFTSKDAIYYRRIRKGSASQGNPFFMRLRNCMKLAREYTRIFFASALRYNFRFYLTQMAGVVKTIIVG